MLWRDPEKELLSYVVGEMNALFEGDFSSDNMLNYARTQKNKIAEDIKVREQVANNTQEQAMMGGFKEKLNDAVIGSMDAHENLAMQILGNDKIAEGFAKVVYQMLKNEMSQNYVVNDEYGLDMVAESNGGYGKS